MVHVQPFCNVCVPSLVQATVCSLHHALDPRQLNNTEMDNMTRLKQLTLQGNCLLLSVMTHDLSSFTEIYRTGLDDDRLVAEVPEDVMAAKLVSH